jgi:hypothetical protein
MNTIIGLEMKGLTVYTKDDQRHLRHLKGTSGNQ